MNYDDVQFFALVGLVLLAVIILLAVRFRLTASPGRLQEGDEVYTQDGYFGTVDRKDGRLIILRINGQGDQLAIRESGIESITKRKKKE